MNFMGESLEFYENKAENGVAAPALEEREHMFDKVVTPSDVGKLNRLVIPKQHAEKYFPLDSSSSGGAAGEKGLLLNFEDRNGKAWRFRYSYWNSSQSYVMTKGWSRFVKEKKLDAGDIVSFHRGAGNRLFIDWRRRPDAPPDHLLPHPSPHYHYPRPTWAPSFFRHQPPHYFHHHLYSGGIVTGNPCPPGSIMYLRPPPPPPAGRAHGSSSHVDPQQMVFESVPVVQGKAAAKRLRLFGVNMDCSVSAEDSDDVNIGDFNGNHSNSISDHGNVLLPSSTIQLPSTFHSSSSSPSTPAAVRPNCEHGKGKGSMSLDLDI